MAGFSPEVEQRIRALGGTVTPCGGGLLECLTAVRFQVPPAGTRPCFGYPYTPGRANCDGQDAPAFLRHDFADYLEAEQIDAARESGSMALSDVSYPFVQWKVELFTPWEAETADNEEWEGTIDDTAIAELTGRPSPQIIFIANTGSWPNYYFCVGDDPYTTDPAVYSTDHEVLFSEVEQQGHLSDFLADLLTEHEFNTIVAQIVNG